jgi:hypothetical protein
MWPLAVYTHRNARDHMSKDGHRVTDVTKVAIGMTM